MALTPPRDIAAVNADTVISQPTAKQMADQLSAMPYHIAMILDGTVQAVFHVEERMAALLLSEPIIMQCEAPNAGGPDTGWSYDHTSKTFKKPE